MFFDQAMLAMGNVRAPCRLQLSLVSHPLVVTVLAADVFDRHYINDRNEPRDELLPGTEEAAGHMYILRGNGAGDVRLAGGGDLG